MISFGRGWLIAVFPSIMRRAEGNDQPEAHTHTHIQTHGYNVFNLRSDNYTLTASLWVYVALWPDGCEGDEPSAALWHYFSDGIIKRFDDFPSVCVR